MVQPDDEALFSVAEAASEALDTPVEELPPLSESVNLGGLAALLGDDAAGDVTVTFPYAGLRVFAHSGGFVYVRPEHGDAYPGREETYVHRG